VYCVAMIEKDLNLNFAVHSEAASESLPIAEALRMLRMSSADELRDWAKSRDREWDVDVKSGVVRLREEHKTDIEVCEFPHFYCFFTTLLCSVTTIIVVFKSYHQDGDVEGVSIAYLSIEFITVTEQMPSQKLIIETLSYAKELERIV
jgi:hypothetical protein